MKLFILRHGQAETFAASDAARQLTESGREEVRGVVRKSAEVLAEVKRIWVSPLLRAQQTADVVLEVLGDRRRETSDLLLPESTPLHVLDKLTAEVAKGQSTGDSYLLVSHQPLVGELVNGICGKPNGYYPMNTGALAHLDLDVPALGCGQLVWLR
jgi:phosphohistidine phosphatase